MKLALRILLPCVLVVCLFQPASAADSTIPKEVMSAAEAGLTTFTARVSARPSQFGFANSEEVQQVTLGEGFHVHYVDPDKLRNTANATSLLDLAFDAHVWEYVVKLNGQPKTLLTVALQGGTYRLVQFGASASNLTTAATNFHRFAGDKLSTQEPVVVKAGPVYYLAGKIGNEELVLAALPPRAGWFGGMNYDQPTAAADVVKYLQEIQKNTPPGDKTGGGGAGVVTEMGIEVPTAASGAAPTAAPTALPVAVPIALPVAVPTAAPSSTSWRWLTLGICLAGVATGTAWAVTRLRSRQR